jgi:hypothetical protein
MGIYKLVSEPEGHRAWHVRVPLNYAGMYIAAESGFSAVEE